MENIFRYIEEKKYSPYQAALAATAEIGMAVLAITLSLVAVFLPIAMMEGIVGMFLRSFGITMAATIMVSMLVSFTLTPMLAARWFKGHADTAGAAEGHGAHHAAGSGSKNQVFYHVIEQAYLAVLRFCLRQRWVVVLAVIGCMGTLPLLFKMVNKNFLPDDDASEFQVNVQAPEGTSLEATQVLIARIARDIRQLDGVRYTIASVADTEQRIPYEGMAYVRLVNIANRDYDQFQVMNFVRQKILPKYAADNLRISVNPAAVFSGGGMSAGDIQYMIGGRDMEKLEQYAKAVMEDLRKVPGAVDVDSSLSLGKPQYVIAPDRAKAAELGVSIMDIANTLRLLVAGDKVTDYSEKGEQYEVHVRSIADVRNHLDELKMVTVPSSKQTTVPLGDVVRFEKGTGPAQINRLARTRQVTINANMAPDTSQQMVLDEIDKSVAKLNMGPEYTTGLLGKSKEMAKTFRAFGMAFILAFIFVYLCIAAQFESWLHPITILLSLPLTLPFALVSLLIFHQSLNIFSLLGILVLFAVVKKNSILQIDHTNQLRAAGMSRMDAMIAANRDRLRPILMTTVAFVAGMIPTLISNAEGAAVNKAISGVIVGGQSLSLLLTLLATPVAYSLFDDLGNLIARLFGRTSPHVEPDHDGHRPSSGGNGNGDKHDTPWLKRGDETIVVHRESSRKPIADG
jgi:HAE1 family hydrophobic/amphiphilic exporter-1